MKFWQTAAGLGIAFSLLSCSGNTTPVRGKRDISSPEKTFKGRYVNPELKGGRYFTVGIEQGGKLVEIKNHTATLRKEGFNLMMIFPRNIKVTANFSTSPILYNGLMAGKSIQQTMGKDHESLSVIAEESFNTGKIMILDSFASHILFVNSAREHSFNHIGNGSFPKMRRYIENYASVDEYAAGKSHPITSISHDVVYLVLFHGSFEKDYNRIDKQVEYIKLIFK